MCLKALYSHPPVFSLASSENVLTAGAGSAAHLHPTWGGCGVRGPWGRRSVVKKLT